MEKFKFERMFIFGLFSIFFVTCHKEIGYLFQYCLLHWVAMTKIWFVCCTESLRQTESQTESLSHELSHCDEHIFCLSHWVTATNKICICWGTNSKSFQKIGKLIQKSHKNVKKAPKVLKLAKSKKKCSIFGPFWHLFSNVSQFCLSLWLRATNKKSAL